MFDIKVGQKSTRDTSMMLPIPTKPKSHFYTGCPKKTDPRLMGHRGHQKWTKDKSWVSFAKFRLFPFKWTQKLHIFVKKLPRKTRSNMVNPLEKWHYPRSPCRFILHS